MYKAINKETAESELLKLEEKWGKKYPVVIKSWKDKWDNLSAYFKYPHEIRRIIYTTNIIESVHRQFRKLTKTKGAFPNENSLLKLLYLGIQNAKKKWTIPVQNWGLTLSQLSIFFPDRIKNTCNTAMLNYLVLNLNALFCVLGSILGLKITKSCCLLTLTNFYDGDEYF